MEDYRSTYLLVFLLVLPLTECALNRPGDEVAYVNHGEVKIPWIDDNHANVFSYTWSFKPVESSTYQPIMSWQSGTATLASPKVLENVKYDQDATIILEPTSETYSGTYRCVVSYNLGQTPDSSTDDVVVTVKKSTTSSTTTSTTTTATTTTTSSPTTTITSTAATTASSPNSTPTSNKPERISRTNIIIIIISCVSAAVFICITVAVTCIVYRKGQAKNVQTENGRNAKITDGVPMASL